MREVTVAVVQTSPVVGKVEENLERMDRRIEEICTSHHVDLIVFPELATTGYECGIQFNDLAERVPGHTVNYLAQRASEFGTHILFGMVEKGKMESVVYNAAILINPDGEVLADYQKAHLKGEEKLVFRPGYRYSVAETNFGTIGILIGWDLAFPEVARSLALQGAELLCVPANWESPHANEWRSYTFARAYENSAFVVAANRSGEEYTYSFFGNSLVVGPRGQVLATVESSEEETEGYQVVRLDLSDVKRAREEFKLLQSRLPRTYREVVKMY